MYNKKKLAIGLIFKNLIVGEKREREGWFVKRVGIFLLAACKVGNDMIRKKGKERQEEKKKKKKKE